VKIAAPQYLQSKKWSFAFVLLLHAGLLLLLHSVMQTTMPAKLAEAISAYIVPEFRPPELPKLVPPPPAQPKTQTLPPLQTAPVLTSQAILPPAQAPSALPAIAAASAVPSPATVAVPQPTAPVKLPIIIPPSRVESSCAAPRYPAASSRLREEGVVTLRFLISENGQVLSGMVEKTSDYKRLDDAALAALSLCKFKPATVDGKPKQDWSTLRYRWELKDE
jgi:periplasmic protein TonB